MGTSISRVSVSVGDAMDEREARKQVGWIEEVAHVEDPAKGSNFMDFEEWQQRYEPVEEEEKEDEQAVDENPGFVKTTVVGTISSNAKYKVLSVFTEVLAKTLSPAEAALMEVEPEMSRLLNACKGIVLTYRFEYIDKEQFTFIRSIAANNLASSLVDIIDRQCDVLGIVDSQDLKEEEIQQIVDNVSQRIASELDQKQKEATSHLQESPMFHKAIHAAGLTEEDATGGLEQLTGFIRSFVDSKMHMVVSVIRTVVSQLVTKAVSHQKTIKEYRAKVALAKKEMKEKDMKGKGAELGDVAAGGEEKADGNDGEVEAQAPAPDGEENKADDAEENVLSNEASSENVGANGSEAGPASTKEEMIRELITLKNDSEYHEIREELLGDIENAYRELEKAVHFNVDKMLQTLTGVKLLTDEQIAEEKEKEKQKEEKEQAKKAALAAPAAAAAVIVGGAEGADSPSQEGGDANFAVEEEPVAIQA